jgi:hypothetical protein
VEDPKPEQAKTGRPSAYSEEVALKIIDACGKGFTMEKAAELVGLEPKTVANWTSKRPQFGERIKKARRQHELSLLSDIEAAGAKSWQAKAWMAERVYNYSQPSARLQVSGDVNHGVNGSFAALLAGIASRKMKNVTPEKLNPKNSTLNVDAKLLPSKTENHLSHTNYCIKPHKLLNDNTKLENICKDVNGNKYNKPTRPRKKAASIPPHAPATPPDQFPTHKTPPENSDQK